MKRIILHATTLFFAVLVLSGTILHSPRSFAAGMTDYCQVPPYVVQNIAPNVMLMVDSSGSMFNFSYYDGFNTPTNLGDDDLCTNSGSPCTGFTDPGTYPGYKYYGYFDSDYWYTYSSNRFVPSAPKTGSGLSGARDKLSTEWDGNFLNWLTMRRVDILRRENHHRRGSQLQPAHRRDSGLRQPREVQADRQCAGLHPLFGDPEALCPFRGRILQRERVGNFLVSGEERQRRWRRFRQRGDLQRRGPRPGPGGGGASERGRRPGPAWADLLQYERRRLHPGPGGGR